MSYTVTTLPNKNIDPSVRLDDLTQLQYSNNNLFPTYGNSYDLLTQSGDLVSSIFPPYASPVSITQSGYIAFDASNVLFIVNQSQTPSICKFINNSLVALDYTFTDNYIPQAIAFDASGMLYITCTVNMVYAKQSRIIKLNPNAASFGFIFQVSGVVINDARGLAFDISGNLFVVDRGNNNVVKIVMVDYGNGIGTIYTPFYAGLNGPMDVAVDKFNNIYIANALENNVIKITTSGAASIFASGFDNPTTLLYSRNDSILYVANYGATYPDTTYIAQVINGIVYNFIQINYPFGLATNSNGELFTTSANDNRETTKVISIVNIHTFYDGSYNVAPLALNQYISPATSLTFDTSNNLYVAQYNDISQSPINSNGSIYRILGTDLTRTPVLFYPLNVGDIALNNPTALAFDSSQILYVANANNDNIIKINTSSAGSLFNITGASLNNPSALVFDATGKLYIANYNDNNIVIVTVTSYNNGVGVIYNITGAPLSNPCSLDFNNTYTNLYISNFGNNTILKVSLSTNIATIYNTNGLSIQEPKGIVFEDDTGRLYVNNSSTNQLYMITNNNTVSAINIIPSTISIIEPAGIALDGSGNIYIANYGNQTQPVVQVILDISSNVPFDGALSSFYQPTDVCPYQNSLYICNYAQNTINQIDYNNQFSIYVTDSRLYYSTSLTINANVMYVVTVNNGIISIDMTTDPPTVYNFIVTGITLNVPGNIRTRGGYLYLANTGSNQIIKITINSLTSGTGIVLPITGVTLNSPYSIAFDQANKLYIGSATPSNPNIPYNDVIQVNLNTNVGSIFSTIPTDVQINGLAFGFKYRGEILYAACNELQGSLPTQFYQITPNGVSTPFSSERDSTALKSVSFIPWEDALVTTDANNSTIDKTYLSFLFYDLQIPTLDNVLSINQVDPFIWPGPTIITTFDVFNNYIVVDPPTISSNTPSSLIVHFVEPNILPYPTDSYVLRYNGTTVSDVMCNNCTFNSTRFIAGTFPTAITSPISTINLFVALKNNTISTISATIVTNNVVPLQAELHGPISLVNTPGLLNPEPILYVLNSNYDNSYNGFISKVTFSNGVTTVNNSFYTGLFNPICITNDNHYLYVLYGISPNVYIKRISMADPTISIVLNLKGGTLYNPLGLTIDAYNPQQIILYVSDQNPNDLDVYKITAIDITNIVPETEVPSRIFIDGLHYQPFTMTNNNNGYLYIANKTDNSLSKIYIPPLSYIDFTQGDPYRSLTPGLDFERWVVTGISSPTGLCFDASTPEVLYVANGGTNPNNTRISKIYTYGFYFNNVVIPNADPDATLCVFDLTTNSYVPNACFTIAIT